MAHTPTHLEDEEEIIPGSTPDDYVDASTPEEDYADTSAEEDFADAAPEPTSARPPRPPVLSTDPSNYEVNLNRAIRYKQAKADFESRQKEIAEKREYQRQKAEHNAAARAESAATGKQYNTDAAGIARPRIDPATGQQAVVKREGTVQYAPKTGKPYRVIQNEGGIPGTKIVDADANVEIGENPDDPDDEQIYRKRKFAGWEPLGTPDELLNHTENKVVIAAARAGHRRELEKNASEQADISLRLKDPKRAKALSLNERTVHESSIKSLAKPIPEPAPKTSFFGGINQEATEQARRKWNAEDTERKALLEQNQAALRGDDERISLEQKAYDLDIDHKAKKDAGAAGFLQRRRKEKASELGNLPPEQINASIERESAGIGEMDAEIQAASAEIQARSDALAAKAARGGTAAEVAQWREEENQLYVDSANVEQSLAERNSRVQGLQTGIETAKQKAREEEKARRAEMRKNPELAPSVDALDALDAEEQERSAKIQAMPEGVGKDAAQKILGMEISGKRDLATRAIKKVQYPEYAKQESRMRKYVASLPGNSPEKAEAQAGLDEMERNLGQDPDYQAARASEQKFNDQVQIVADESSRLLESREGMSAFDSASAREAIGVGNVKNLEALTMRALESLDTKEQVERFRSAVTNRRVEAAIAAVPTVPVDFWETLGKLKSNPEKMLPFIASIPELAGIADIRKSAMLAQEGRAQDDDLVALARFAAEGHREKTFMGGVAEVLSVLPSFAGELVFTGGLYTIGKQAALAGAKKGMEKLMSKGAAEWVEKMAISKLGEGGARQLLGQLAVKAPISMVGSLVQSPIAGITRMPVDFAQRTMPKVQEMVRNEKGEVNFLMKEGEGNFEAALNSVGSGYVEVFSERSGAGFDILGKLIGKAVPPKLRGQIAKAFLFGKWTAKGNAPSKFANFLKSAGWNGVFQEIGEERIGDLARGFTDFVKGIASGQGVTEAAIDAAKNNTPTGKQWLTELVAFSIPGAAISGANALRGTGAQAPAQRPPILPENIAAARAEIESSQVPPDRITAMGAALKLVTGTAFDALTKAEQGAVKPHVAELDGEIVVTDDILGEMQSASPAFAEIVQQGSVSDEGTRRRDILQKKQAILTPEESAASEDQAGEEPPLPLGKAGRLITAREHSDAKQISTALEKKGVENIVAERFAGYVVRRDGTAASPEKRAIAAVQEFERAGGMKSPGKILVAISAGERYQAPQVDEIYKNVVAKLESSPDAKSYRDLSDAQKAKLADVIKNRIAPEILTFGKAIASIGSRLKGAGSGGVTAKENEVVLSIEDILSKGNFERLSDDRGVERVINEEVGHVIGIQVIAAIRRERTGDQTSSDMDLALAESEEIWEGLPKGIQSQVRVIREMGGETSAQRGMEFLRMVLQHDLAVDENGRIVKDGAILTEETLSPGILARIKKIIAAFIKTVSRLESHLRETLPDSPQKEGYIARVQEIRKKSVEALKNFQKQADESRSEEYREKYERTIKRIRRRTDADSKAKRVAKDAGGGEGTPGESGDFGNGKGKREGPDRGDSGSDGGGKEGSPTDSPVNAPDAGAGKVGNAPPDGGYSVETETQAGTPARSDTGYEFTIAFRPEGSKETTTQTIRLKATDIEAAREEQRRALLGLMNRGTLKGAPSILKAAEPEEVEETPASASLDDPAQQEPAEPPIPEKPPAAPRTPRPSTTRMDRALFPVITWLEEHGGIQSKKKAGTTTGGEYEQSGGVRKYGAFSKSIYGNAMPADVAVSGLIHAGIMPEGSTADDLWVAIDKEIAGGRKSAARLDSLDKNERIAAHYKEAFLAATAKGPGKVLAHTGDMQVGQILDAGPAGRFIVEHITEEGDIVLVPEDAPGDELRAQLVEAGTFLYLSSTIEDDMDVPFSIAEKPTAGIGVASAQRAIRAIATRLGLENILQNVEIVGNITEKPVDKFDTAKGLNYSIRQNATGQIEGYYDPRTGKSVINASAISSPKRAIEVFLHEVVGHGGMSAALRGINPKGYENLKKLLQNYKREDGTTLWADVQARYPGATPEVLFDEALARLAENPTRSEREENLFKRIVAAIRQWLAKRGFSNWTAADVDALIRRAAEGLRQRRGQEASRIGDIIRSIRTATGLGVRSILPNGYVVTEPGIIPVGISFSPASRRAFHGTPHDVGRFSTEKIGTGEGAQAFGWGLYFAENPNIAKGYAERLSKGGVNQHKVFDSNQKALAAWKDWEESNPKEAAAFREEIEDLTDRSISDTEVGIELQNALGGYRQVDTPLDGAKSTGKSDIFDPEGSNNTYTVDLDVDHDSLLDWDKPLSEQSEKVKAAVREAFIEGGLPLDEKGEPLALERNPDGQSVQVWLSGAKSKKSASELLNRLGIHGIRYLDQGSRGVGATAGALSVQEDAAGEGWVIVSQGKYFNSGPYETKEIADAALRDAQGTQTYNYVIFDESKIKILEQNGRPVTDDEIRYSRLGENRDQLGFDFEAVDKNASEEQPSAMPEENRAAENQGQPSPGGLSAEDIDPKNLPNNTRARAIYLEAIKSGIKIPPRVEANGKAFYMAGLSADGKVDAAVMQQYDPAESADISSALFQIENGNETPAAINSASWQIGVKKAANAKPSLRSLVFAKLFIDTAKRIKEPGTYFDPFASISKGNLANYSLGETVDNKVREEFPESYARMMDVGKDAVIKSIIQPRMMGRLEWFMDAINPQRGDIESGGEFGDALSVAVLHDISRDLLTNEEDYMAAARALVQKQKVVLNRRMESFGEENIFAQFVGPKSEAEKLSEEAEKETLRAQIDIVSNFLNDLPESPAPSGGAETSQPESTGKESLPSPATPEPAQPTAGKLEDFGEILPGAKKMLERFRSAMDAGLPDDVADISLSKHFPEPDYAKLLEDGVPLRKVAAIKACRDLVPRKPQASWKLRRWGEMVKTLHATLAKISDESITVEQLDGILNQLQLIKPKVDLYEAIGFPAAMGAKEWQINQSKGISVWGGKDISPSTLVTYAESEGRWRYDVSSLNPDPQAAFQEVADMIREKITGEQAKPDTVKKAVEFSVYRDTRTGDNFIGKKGLTGVIRLKTGFPKAKDALNYRDDNRAELEKLWEDIKRPINERRPANLPREGIPRHEGNVSPAMFSEAFGFRGVQFGNWMEGDRRQNELNEAFDALMDLAEVLSIPPKALSLDGSLGLAFGARGGGDAKAHYEPGTVVINITKPTGAGSLAHEWFHALDNYFARFDKTGDTAPASLDRWASDTRDEAAHVRPAVWAAWQGIRKAMATGTYADKVMRADAAKSKPYYSKPIEKAARGFEIYTLNRMADSAISNDYLVNLSKEGEEKVYPSPQEMAGGIRQAFDTLFNTMESVETDKGVRLQEVAEEYRKSLVDRAAARAYAQKVGASNIEEATDGISRTLQFTAGGRMGRSGSYVQGDFFGGQGAGGTGTAAVAAGKAAAAALLPTKAGALAAPGGVASQDLIAGLHGDWAALAREIDAKGRASSIFADLVNNKIPDWDVTGTKIEGPEDIMALMQPIRSPYFESLKVMVLDGNNNVAYSQILHVGSLNESIADPRRIFSALTRLREQTDKNYQRIIISHNHPSGDPTPSDSDRRIQADFNEVARATGWDVFDHIITNGETFYSFRDAGLAGGTGLGKEYTPRKDVGERPKPYNPLAKAPWEALHRGDLAHMDDGGIFADAAKFLRNGNPDSAHIFYLNTRMRLMAVERISLKDFRDSTKLNRTILAGMAREGGYGFVVEAQGVPSQSFQEIQMQLLRFSRAAHMKFIDFVLTNSPGEINPFYSFEDAGRMREDAAPYGVAAVVREEAQAEFNFLPSDQPQAARDAEKTALSRFQDELPQAMRIAFQYANIPGVDGDEVRQTARVALAHASRAFDPARGKPWSALAGVAVRNRLRTLYRKEDIRRQRFPVSLDEPIGSDSQGIPATRGDFARDTRTPSAPESAEIREARELLESAISELHPKMQTAIRGYLASRKLEDIARELGASKQAAQQLQKVGFERLRRKLGERGVTSTKQILLSRPDIAPESKAAYWESLADTPVPVTASEKSDPATPESARAWWEKNGSRELARGNIRAKVSKTSIAKATSGSKPFPEARAAAVSHLQELFAGGYIDARPDDGRDPQVEEIMEIYAPFLHEGQVYRVRLLTKVFTEDSGKGTKFHSARIEDVILEKESARLEKSGGDALAVPSPASPGNITIRQMFGGVNPHLASAEILSRPDLGEEDGIDQLLRELEDAGVLDEMSDWQEAALAEQAAGGGKKIGRPDLAYGAANPDVRGVDEFYTGQFVPESEALWRKQAEDMLSSDYEGTLKAIQLAGLHNEPLSPAQTIAAGIIATKMRRDMILGDSLARRAFNLFWYAYRATGSAIGRAMAARRDPFMTPARRNMEFLLELMHKPGRKAQKRIDAAPTDAEKDRRIADLERRLKVAVAQANAHERAGLEKELTAARKEKTKEYLIDSETQALLDKLKAAGITPQDILKDKVSLSLVYKKIRAEFRELLSRPDSSPRKDAFDLILKNKSFADIAKKTGLPEGEVRQIKADFIKAMRKDHFAKFQAGAKANGKSLITGKRVDDATAEREFAKFLKILGIVDDAVQGKPKFDIEDPAHVMRMARAIQAARGDATLLDMAYEWWIMNILSGPQTHVANVSGNLGMAALNLTIQRGMEVLVNLAVRDSKSAQLGEFKWLVKGLMPGLSRGYALAARAWSAEHDFFENTVIGTPLEIDQGDKLGGTRSSIPGQAGRIIRIPGRLLLFADALFKGAIGQMEAGAFAYRLAKAQGLRGKALSDRIELLLKTRGEVISENFSKATPSGEMVNFFAERLARGNDEISVGELLADKTSDAWTLAREQTAFDLAKKAGWSEAAWERAVESAQVNTFQQELRTTHEGGNVFEDVAAKLQNARFGNKLIALFFPFVRTPYNIFRIGIRKSPLGSANLAWQAARGLYSLKDGKPYVEGHPEAVRDLAEQAIAWGAMALLFAAAQGDDDDDEKQFLLTGSQPRTLNSQGERDLNTRAFGGEYIIRIGGRDGIYIPYGRLEPIATVLGTIVDSIRAIKRNGTPSDSMAALWNYMVGQGSNKSFLQGVSTVSDLAEGRQDPVGTTRKMLLQALVPNIVRSPLRSMDDYARDTKLAGAAYTTFPTGSLAEPKIGIYGEEVKKSGSPLLRIFFNTPLATEPTLQAADKFLIAWNRENPDDAWAPKEPGDSFKGSDGKMQSMTAEESRKFRVAAGRLAVVKLRGVVSDADARNPTEATLKRVKSAIEDARADAKKALFNPGYLSRRGK